MEPMTRPEALFILSLLLAGLFAGLGLLTYLFESLTRRRPMATMKRGRRHAGK